MLLVRPVTMAETSLVGLERQLAQEIAVVRAQVMASSSMLPIPDFTEDPKIKIQSDSRKAEGSQ